MSFDADGLRKPTQVYQSGSMIIQNGAPTYGWMSPIFAGPFSTCLLDIKKIAAGGFNCRVYMLLGTVNDPNKFEAIPFEINNFSSATAVGTIVRSTLDQNTGVTTTVGFSGTPLSALASTFPQGALYAGATSGSVGSAWSPLANFACIYIAPTSVGSGTSMTISVTIAFS